MKETEDITFPKMERNRIYLMTEDEKSSSATALFAPRKEGHVTRKLVKQPGSLELIELGDKRSEKERPPSESSTRSWSRTSVGSVPPRSDSSLSRRTMTPTKQISLQAVKRKEESSDPFFDDVDIDLDSIGFDGSRQRRKRLSDNEGCRPLSENSFVEDEFITLDSGVTDDHCRSSRTQHPSSLMEEFGTDIYAEKLSENLTEDDSKNRLPVHKESLYKSEEDRKEGSSSDTDDNVDDDVEEKVKLRAPNELLMEFVDCLMKKDFPNAEKLCKMILLYEPENPEALKFKPLIEEKMKLDAEAAAAAEEEGDSDDDEEDDDDDSDDDDSDEDEDDDTSSSDEDSSEEEDDDRVNIPTSSENVLSTSAQIQASKDIKGANSLRVWKPAS